MALYLMQEQSMYPYCLEGRILNEGKYLQTLYMHQKQLEEKCSQKEKRKVQFQLEIQNLQAYDKRVDKAQDTLKERFQRTDGYDQPVHGQHDPQKMIQGLQDVLYILQRMIHTFPVWRRMLPLLPQVHIGEKYRIRAIYRPEHGRIRTEECI